MLVTIVSISISGKEHRRYTNYCQVKHFYMKAEFHCLISVWKEYPMYNKSDSGIDSIILQHATIIEREEEEKNRKTHKVVDLFKRSSNAEEYSWLIPP
ncbi:hypothetical protein QQP08_008924 [Theobroma cacao]|nr:hypothetical protein QQP08_008924 [Theobroma cacao]